jgi:uncharacterized metal-binding protein
MVDFFMLPFNIATRIHPLFGILLIVLYLSFLIALILAPIALISETLEKSAGKK